MYGSGKQTNLYQEKALQCYGPMRVRMKLAGVVTYLPILVTEDASLEGRVFIGREAVTPRPVKAMTMTNDKLLLDCDSILTGTFPERSLHSYEILLDTGAT